MFKKIFSVNDIDNQKQIIFCGIKIKFNKLILVQKLFCLKHKLLRLFKIGKNIDFDKFVITKFNISIAYNDKYYEDILNEQYLEKRFDLFERYYIPSLKAQTDKNYKAIVLFHPKTPEKYKEKIKKYEEELNGIFIPYYTEYWDTELLKKVVIKYSHNADWVMTIRLDNDDAIPLNYVKTVKDYFLPINKMFISFANGAILEDKTNFVYEYSNNSYHFLAMVENLKSNFDTVYFEWHDNVRLKCPNFLLIKTPGKPMWLEVVHDSNVSNRPRKHKRTDEKILDRFCIKK